MKRTGIFLYHQQGERLRDFPQALEGILDKDNVFLYDAFYPLKPPDAFALEPIPVELLHQVHTPAMVEQVRQSPAFEGALFSAAGVVAAAIRIWRGEIDNAFVFTGYGDHHAGRDFYGGGCYFNGAAIAISQLRRRFGVTRFAILDSDAHHGDGTWDIFQADDDVLYICFCSMPAGETNHKINVRIPWHINDREYLRLVSDGALPKLKAFRPDLIFWNWGYDGSQGEYGDIGITPDIHARLARLFQAAADELCQGRLVVVLCGGSRRDLARRLAPQVIRVLAEQEPPT